MSQVALLLIGGRPCVDERTPRAVHPYQRSKERAMAGKIFVGITDGDWYDFLRDRRATEVNFWKPSGRPFKVLDEGDLFLFKLKAARGGRIAGGALVS